MGIAVKKTISLPPELAREVEEIARQEKKPISAVIQDALRIARRERLKAEFYQIQNYWSRKAKERGVLTAKDLETYLRPSTRVVFGTSIFISALVIPGNFAEKAMLKIIEGGDILVISKDIINEVLSVLSSKCNREKIGISHAAVILSDLGELVKPTKKVSIFKDDPDNRILECAIHGKTDVLITGDKEMLQSRGYKGTKIISLKEFIES